MPIPLRDLQQPLERNAALVAQRRRELGLDQLIGPPLAVVINTQPHLHRAAVAELLRFTGLDVAETFEDEAGPTCVLRVEGSVAVVVQARRRDVNPFAHFVGPKSSHMPGTRLETLVFECSDLRQYAAIQAREGTAFMGESVDAGSYLFTQTMPSLFTGLSIGLVQWRDQPGCFAGRAKAVAWPELKPPLPHLGAIGRLDHLATRLHAQHRDDAILEFMRLTGYDYSMAYSVESLNSITSVARRCGEKLAMVFTSGIPTGSGAVAPPDQVLAPPPDLAGPTESFVLNYGPRVHHLAFTTREIEHTVEALREDGLRYMIDLVGSPQEGLKQCFTVASPNTMLVMEYIWRYGDFDGFFTRSNVTALTRATIGQ